MNVDSVMTYVVMAYVVMARTARIAMAYVVVAYVAMAHEVMAHIVLGLLAYVVMAYKVMANTVVAYKVMVMAWPPSQPRHARQLPDVHRYFFFAKSKGSSLSISGMATTDMLPLLMCCHN